MIAVADSVQRLGFALLIAGYGTWAVVLLVRLIIVFRTREFPASIWVVGFYARTVGTLGILVMAFGPVIRGEASWLLLLGVFIIGGPALALLIVRPVSARDLLAVNPSCLGAVRHGANPRLLTQTIPHEAPTKSDLRERSGSVANRASATSIECRVDPLSSAVDRPFVKRGWHLDE